MKWKLFTLISILLISLVLVVITFYKKDRNLGLDLFTEYAINFKIDYTKESNCGKLPNINDDLKSILINHKKNTLFKRNISLIILQFYNCDINNYQVGYELRKSLFFNHPLVTAYYDTLKDTGRTSFEFVPTTDVFEIINKRPKLFSDKHLLTVMQETCKIFESKGQCKNLPFNNSICKSACL